MSSRNMKSTPSDLFRRPDGQPYEFWIQIDLEPSLRQSICEMVQKHGGRITKFGEFPEHGFLLIDPTQTHPLYEIKSTFHKPVNVPMFLRRSKNATATPLRHVLSYSFVQDAIRNGHWDYRDLRRWGWPLTLPPMSRGIESDKIAQYTEEMQLGVDEQLEKGWIWATGRTFDRFDPTDKFPKEFEELEQRLQADPPRDINRIRNRESGKILARLKHEQQVGFFLHESIPREKQYELVEIIMRNGGRTCHEQGNADILLVDCTIRTMRNDEGLGNLATTLYRRKQAGEPYTPLVHAGWINACIKAGDWRMVGIQDYDMMMTYIRAKGHNRFGTSDPVTNKAPVPNDAQEVTRRMEKSTRMQRITAHGTDTVEAVSAGKLNRKRPAEEEADGDVAKKHKRIQEWSASLPASSITSNGSPILLPAEPGSVSTIKGRRIFAGAPLPSFAPSPLQKHQQPASLIVHKSAPESPTKKFRPSEFSLTATSEATRSSAAEKENVERQSERAPRVSAASGTTITTNGTDNGSKVLNTTIETMTTLSKSARSVGPAPPPNAKQIPRPSTSTAISNNSGASRGAVDEHQVHAVRIYPTAIEPDDAAAEQILNHFDPFTADQPAPPFESGLPATDKDEPAINMAVTQFEKDLVLCLRGLREYDAEEELEYITLLVKGWPALEKRKEEERRALRLRKGKGRVSFKDLSPVMTSNVEAESEHGPESEEEDELFEESEDLPPRMSIRAALRRNHSSVTPESHEPTDFEDEDFRPSNQESDEMSSGGGMLDEAQGRASSRTPRAPTSASTRVTRSHPTVTSIDMLPEASPAAFRSRPPETNPESTKQNTLAGKHREQGTESTREAHEGDQNQGEGTDEGDDDVAPLPEAPVRKSRTTRKRSVSVVSDTESVNAGVKPRRGRSASVISTTPKGTQTRRKGMQPAKSNVAKRGRRK